jgi:uncharacterized OB-fold protein
MSSPPRVYSAQHVLHYDYRRSVGPVLGRFFTDLRDRRIVANRTASGRVLCPPMEHDPETGAATSPGFLEVGPGGALTSWSWVPSPRAKHPLSRPFAWALIRLDGADTALLHAVDAGSEARLRTGMRVVPRWRAETRGEIGDIECFEPEEPA